MNETNTVDKFAVARVLREISLLSSLRQGESRFRARAYEAAADTLENLTEDVGGIASQGRLTSLHGIGQTIADTILEVLTTGSSRYLERLRAEFPPGIVELTRIPGLGLKKVRAMYDALGIADIAGLEAACRSGKVRSVPGFGVRTEAAILAGIARYRKMETDSQILLLDADELARRLVTHLRDSRAAIEISVAGSVRRRRETVRDIDLVVATRDPSRIREDFARFPLFTGTDRQTDDDTISARLASGMQVDLYTAPPDRYGSVLLRATGSAAHVTELETKRFPKDAASETEAYAELGLPFIPPELREGAGEIAAARAGDRFEDLVDTADIRGAVHCHTVYSDGKHTIEEMALEARRMGLAYLTITDHSPSAGYAGGVEVDRLAKQWDEIAQVQERVPEVRILRGTESDILADGALDYPDRILEQLDVVIASVHSRMKMDEAQMTARLVAAMRQPIFKIWGHALGRLLLRRPPFACRVEAVLDAISESRAAIEINGDPHRLDMEPRWLREARNRNIRFVISTDAHSTRSLHNLPYGVGLARRAGLRRSDVLNCLDAKGFVAAVRPV